MCASRDSLLTLAIRLNSLPLPLFSIEWRLLPESTRLELMSNFPEPAVLDNTTPVGSL